MSKIYRVAVIGGGGAIGQDHIRSFQQSPHAQVVAIAETSRERGEEAIRKFKVPDLHEDYHDLLRRKDVDVISIALPNYLHAPVAIEAFKAGKHVLLDKPMATNARDGAKILKAARSARKVFMVGQNMRFSPESQTLKAAIQTGKLGKIYHAHAYWLRRSGIPRIGSWFTQKKFAGGGACYDIGVHLLDLALHLLGRFDVTSVSGSTSGFLGSKGIGDGSWGRSEIDPRKIFDVEDRARALIKFKNGSTLFLDVAWAAFQGKEDSHNIDLFGDKAGATWHPLHLFRPGADGFVVEQLNWLKKFEYPHERMMHFMECVALGKKPLVQPEQSLVVQKVLDGIYESSKTGREVRIK